MQKETLFIAISNQKGGVGKSVITTLVSSYLYLNKGQNIIVIDCDYPQHSIHNMREDDKKTVAQSGELQSALAKQFEVFGKKAYPIIRVKSEDALEDAYKLLDNAEVKPDIIFFDLPGTVNSTGIINLILNMNYIFVPIIADKRVLQSSLAFVLTVREYMKSLSGKINLKEIHMFWNKVDKREHTDLYDEFNELLMDQQIPLLRTELPDTKRYNKELSVNRNTIFRSTLFPPDKRLLRNSHLDKLIKEIIYIIKR